MNATQDPEALLAQLRAEQEGQGQPPPNYPQQQPPPNYPPQAAPQYPPPQQYPQQQPPPNYPPQAAPQYPQINPAGEGDGSTPVRRGRGKGKSSAGNDIVQINGQSFRVVTTVTFEPAE
jgi:hypothetical protein